MSCCNECEQSGGSCNQGLGLLGATLIAGSQVRVGFRIARGAPALDYSIQDIVSRIESCLYQSNSFDYVGAVMEPEGIFSNAYVSIGARVVHDFAQVEDAGGFIQQQLQRCFPELTIGLREATAVEYYPSGSGNYSTAAEQAVARQRTPTRTASNPSGLPTAGCPDGYYDASYFSGVFGVDCRKLPDTAAAPSECDWATMSAADYLACQLGIKPTEAVIVGAIGALAGVILISKLAK